MDDPAVSLVQTRESAGRSSPARRTDELAVLGRLACWKPRHRSPSLITGT